MILGILMNKQITDKLNCGVVHIGLLVLLFQQKQIRTFHMLLLFCSVMKVFLVVYLTDEADQMVLVMARFTGTTQYYLCVIEQAAVMMCNVAFSYHRT